MATQTQYTYYPPATKTVAATGTLTSDAALLPNLFTTVTGANGTKGVRLQKPLYGDGDQNALQPAIVYNSDVSGTLKVYPPTGGTIDGGSADASVNLVAGAISIFYFTSVSAVRSVTPATPAVLAGVTPGTVTASKAVVVDSNKDIGEFRNLTLDSIVIGAGGINTIAAAGNSQGTATATTANKTINVVTGADNTVGVVLPTTATGLEVVVYNSDATHTLPVYPGTSGTINGGSANTSITLAPLTGANFIGTSATNWTFQDNVDVRNAQTIAGAKTWSGAAVFSSTVTQTSASANALVTGRQGSTNPTFNVDSSTGSCITGLNVKSNISGSGVAVTALGGTNELITIDTKGTGTLGINTLVNTAGLVTIGNGTNLCGLTVNGPIILAAGVAALTLTSTSASAFTVGRQGATNPVLLVNANTGSVVTGVSVVGAASGGGVAIAAISSSAAEVLKIDALGTSGITIGSVSSGIVSLGRASGKALFSCSTKTTISAQNITPTAAQMLTGYIVHTTVTGGGTCTFDTGTNLDAAIPGVTNNDTFDIFYFNNGTQTGTLTGNTGTTIRGATVAVTTGKTALIRATRQSSAAWDLAVIASA